MRKVLLIALSLVFAVVSVKAEIPVEVTGISVDTLKVFDNSDSAHVTSQGTLVGVQQGHQVTVSTVARYATKNADTSIVITVTSRLHGADSALYVLEDSVMMLSGTIEKRQLYRDSVILMPFKIYDGLVACPIQFSGIARNYVTHHILTTIDTCEFYDPNVGNNKPVRIVFGMSGEDKINYYAPRDTVLYSSIIPRKLLTKNTAVQTVRQYDGTADAQITSRGWFKNVLEDDTVYFNVSASYDDKNAGTGKIINVHYDIYGPDTMNYSAPDDGVYRDCEITHIQLTSTGGEAETSKVYDGSTFCAVTTPSQPVGVLEGEQVYLNTMASYDNAAVGNNHVISFSYTIYGNDAMNYIAPENRVYCTDGVILDVTGVEDVVSVTSVGPNPFTDVVEVLFGNSGGHHIIIYNLGGELIRRETESGESVRLDVSDLVSGMYIFMVDGRAVKMIKK